MHSLIKISNFFLNSRAGLRNFFVKLFTDLVYRNYLLLNFGSVSAAFVLAYLLATKVGDSQMIMHYSVNFGVDYIGSSSSLYYLPAIGFLFYVLNLICAYVFNREDKFFIHLYMLGSFVVNNLIIAAIGSLYLINFR